MCNAGGVIAVEPASVTFAIKAAGPVALGGRELPRWFTGIVVLLGPALLTALVVTQALAHGHHVELGAQTAVVAAGVTAGLRAL